MHDKTNAAGQTYDSHRPFRHVIHVTKGDGRADVIRALSQGRQASAATLAEALQEQDEFLGLVKQITAGKFASYGMIAVIDESTGEIHGIKHIGGAL